MRRQLPMPDSVFEIGRVRTMVDLQLLMDEHPDIENACPVCGAFRKADGGGLMTARGVQAHTARHLRGSADDIFVRCVDCEGTFLADFDVQRRHALICSALDTQAKSKTRAHNLEQLIATGTVASTEGLNSHCGTHEDPIPLSYHQMYSLRFSKRNPETPTAEAEAADVATSRWVAKRVSPAEHLRRRNGPHAKYQRRWYPARLSDMHRAVAVALARKRARPTQEDRSSDSDSDGSSVRAPSAQRRRTNQPDVAQAGLDGPNERSDVSSGAGDIDPFDGDSDGVPPSLTASSDADGGFSTLDVDEGDIDTLPQWEETEILSSRTIAAQVEYGKWETFCRAYVESMRNFTGSELRNPPPPARRAARGRDRHPISQLEQHFLKVVGSCRHMRESYSFCRFGAHRALAAAAEVVLQLAATNPGATAGQLARTFGETIGATISTRTGMRDQMPSNVRQTAILSEGAVHSCTKKLLCREYRTAEKVMHMHRFVPNRVSISRNEAPLYRELAEVLIPSQVFEAPAGKRFSLRMFHPAITIQQLCSDMGEHIRDQFSVQVRRSVAPSREYRPKRPPALADPEIEVQVDSPGDLQHDLRYFNTSTWMTRVTKELLQQHFVRPDVVARIGEIGSTFRSLPAQETPVLLPLVLQSDATIVSRRPGSPREAHLVQLSLATSERSIIAGASLPLAIIPSPAPAVIGASQQRALPGDKPQKTVLPLVYELFLRAVRSLQRNTVPIRLRNTASGNGPIVQGIPVVAAIACDMKEAAALMGQRSCTRGHCRWCPRRKADLLRTTEPTPHNLQEICSAIRSHYGADASAADRDAMAGPELSSRTLLEQLNYRAIEDASPILPGANRPRCPIVNPEFFAALGRIPGVLPADTSVVVVDYLHCVYLGCLQRLWDIVPDIIACTIRNRERAYRAINMGLSQIPGLLNHTGTRKRTSGGGLLPDAGARGSRMTTATLSGHDLINTVVYGLPLIVTQLLSGRGCARVRHLLLDILGAVAKLCRWTRFIPKYPLHRCHIDHFFLPTARRVIRAFTRSLDRIREHIEGAASDENRTPDYVRSTVHQLRVVARGEWPKLHCLMHLAGQIRLYGIQMGRTMEEFESNNTASGEIPFRSGSRRYGPSGETELLLNSRNLAMIRLGREACTPLEPRGAAPLHQLGQTYYPTGDTRVRCHAPGGPSTGYTLRQCIDDWLAAESSSGMSAGSLLLPLFSKFGHHARSPDSLRGRIAHWIVSAVRKAQGNPSPTRWNRGSHAGTPAATGALIRVFSRADVSIQMDCSKAGPLDVVVQSPLPREVQDNTIDPIAARMGDPYDYIENAEIHCNESLNVVRVYGWIRCTCPGDAALADNSFSFLKDFQGCV